MEEILKSIEALYRNQVIINEKLDALLKADIENINEKQQFKFDINMLNSKLDKVISKTSDIEVRLQVLDDINNKSNSEYALTPENFAYFYKSIFPLWRDSLYNNEYHSVGLIEQLITFLLRRRF